MMSYETRSTRNQTYPTIRTQLAKMTIDEILDLTARVFFVVVI